MNVVSLHIIKTMAHDPKRVFTNHICWAFFPIVQKQQKALVCRSESMTAEQIPFGTATHCITKSLPKADVSHTSVILKRKACPFVFKRFFITFGYQISPFNSGYVAVCVCSFQSCWDRVRTTCDCNYKNQIGCIHQDKPNQLPPFLRHLPTVTNPYMWRTDCLLAL